MQVLKSFRRITALGLMATTLQKNFVSYAQQKENSMFNYFNLGTAVYPHPDKIYKGGEDANYSNKNIIAVADGVGGWSEHGIDPANYSKELCQNIKTLWEKDDSNYIKSPKSLIINAAKLTKSIGSSTLCILTLDKNSPTLYSAYIGDSGYMILRKKEDSKELETLFMYKEQQKAFNFPYQIGTQSDSPNLAVSYKHTIQNKDIVVVGSDGLFDNLDKNQICKFISQYIDEKGNLDKISEVTDNLAKVTKKFSLDQTYYSPFAQRARDSGLYYQGGKSDDITIVIGQINLNETPTAKL